VTRRNSREATALVEQQDSGGGLSGWAVGGLVMLGLGLLAWYYLGPDLRRYLKIRNM